MKRLIYTIALLVFFTPFLTAQSKKFIYTETKMGSPFNLILVSTDSNQANTLAQKCFQLIDSNKWKEELALKFFLLGN